MGDALCEWCVHLVESRHNIPLFCFKIKFAHIIEACTTYYDYPQSSRPCAETIKSIYLDGGLEDGENMVRKSDRNEEISAIS